MKSIYIQGSMVDACVGGKTPQREGNNQSTPVAPMTTVHGIAESECRQQLPHTIPQANNSIILKLIWSSHCVNLVHTGTHPAEYIPVTEVVGHLLLTCMITPVAPPGHLVGLLHKDSTAFGGQEGRVQLETEKGGRGREEVPCCFKAPSKSPRHSQNTAIGLKPHRQPAA